MLTPHIILLNGTSSAGKSSIAKELQAILDAPYLHVCIDSFEEMMPNRFDLGGEFAKQSVFAKLLSGMHRSIEALARCGNSLVVDHVLIEGEEPSDWLADCLRVLTEFDVFFVGVHCSLDELERREQIRGDRWEGLARWQSSRMHRDVVYDFEVDTSIDSPRDCAMRIKQALPHSKGGAMTTLRLQEELLGKNPVI